MLDRLGSFHSHSMTNIRTLVGAHYAFCRRPDTSSYVMDLLYKDKFLFEDIENVSNGRPCCGKGCLWIKKRYILQVRGQFLAPIIVDAIVSVFYKAACSARLEFNPATTDFFTSFCPGMLAFLFAMVHCGISEYQGGAKVVIPFDGKIAQSMYFNINHNWLR